jgi:hypothetical protein
MRFLEIANPEDQLALWKLISDKMWAAFAQPASRSVDGQVPRAAISPGRVGTVATPLRTAIPKAATKSTFKAVPKATKPRRAPMAPAPKPLPKPRPQQSISSLAHKQTTQQPQQMAQQLQKELVKARRLQKIQPQPPTPAQKLPTPTIPMAQALGHKEEGELVNSPPVQHPLNGINSAKSARSSRKSGV